MGSKSIVLATLVAACAMFTSCDGGRSAATNPDPSAELGRVEVSIKAGAVGVLARSAQMVPTKIVLEFRSGAASRIKDTILVASTGSILKSYSFPAQPETLVVKGYDQRDSLLYYNGGTVFAVAAGKTTSVGVSLDARYSSLKVRFPVVDSLDRFQLLVDGALWADSSIVAGSRNGDTISVSRDYLTSSLAGNSHALAFRIWGRSQGKDTVLYALDTTVSVVSGQNPGLVFVSRWVGGATKKPGFASLALTVGLLGEVKVDVAYDSGNGIPAGSFRFDFATPADTLAFRRLYGGFAYGTRSEECPGCLASLTAVNGDALDTSFARLSYSLASTGTGPYFANVGAILPMDGNWQLMDLRGMASLRFKARTTSSYADGVFLKVNLVGPALPFAYAGYAPMKVVEVYTEWQWYTIRVRDFAYFSWMKADATAGTKYVKLCSDDLTQACNPTLTRLSARAVAGKLLNQDSLSSPNYANDSLNVLKNVRYVNFAIEPIYDVGGMALDPAFAATGANADLEIDSVLFVPSNSAAGITLVP